MILHGVADRFMVFVHGLQHVYKLLVLFFLGFVYEGVLQAFFLHGPVALHFLKDLHWVLPVEEIKLLRFRPFDDFIYDFKMALCAGICSS